MPPSSIAAPGARRSAGGGWSTRPWRNRSMRDGPERRQFAHDALLVWCSELGSGTWAAFAAAARELGLGASSAARGLSMLGHVEFCWRTRTFAVAPGALTTIPGMPG